MSAEGFEAARKMLLAECAKRDVVITTTQAVPGQEGAAAHHQGDGRLDGPPGASFFNLAASSGGNVETTGPDKVVQVTGKEGQTVHCVGYGNMAGRMANVASQMFGGNVTKLLVSMDRHGQYVVDEADEAVRSMLTVNAGKRLEPYMPPPPPEPKAAAAASPAEEEADPVSPQQKALNEAPMLTGGTTGPIAFMRPGALHLSTAGSHTAGSHTFDTCLTKVIGLSRRN